MIFFRDSDERRAALAAATVALQRDKCLPLDDEQDARHAAAVVLGVLQRSDYVSPSGLVASRQNLVLTFTKADDA